MAVLRRTLPPVIALLFAVSGAAACEPVDPHRAVAEAREARPTGESPQAWEARFTAFTRAVAAADARWRATVTFAARVEAARLAALAAVPSWPWDQLAACESGGNWAINTGNGFYGGLQFTPGSWRATGGTGLPHHHGRAEQIRRGIILQRMQGWGAWPACSRRIGLR